MKYRLKEGVVVEDIDGELVTLNEGGDAAVLNDSASLILKGILEQKDTDEILGMVVTAFDTDEGTARADIKALVSNLVDKELIQKE